MISGVYMNEIKNSMIKMNCPLFLISSQNEMETVTVIHIEFLHYIDESLSWYFLSF